MTDNSNDHDRLIRIDENLKYLCESFEKLYNRMDTYETSCKSCRSELDTKIDSKMDSSMVKYITGGITAFFSGLVTYLKFWN